MFEKDDFLESADIKILDHNRPSCRHKANANE